MSLPLKVRVAIRDLWETPSAPLPTAFAALRTLLGLDISCQPEWPLLYAEMGPIYTDKAEFVHAVVSAVRVWTLALTELLGDDANERWTDTLLDKLSTCRALRLHVEVARDVAPSTSWDAARVAFVLDLPSVQAFDASQHMALLRGQIYDDVAANSLDHKPRAPTLVSDDWTDLDAGLGMASLAGPTPSSSAAAALAHRVKAATAVEYLADPDSLSRPDELFLRPPYHLLVSSRGRDYIEIQCSHSPSLELLASYLKKWCRTNQNRTDKPPIVTITLHQAPFGLGLMYDALTLAIDARRESPLSPAIILSLVESVLGYERVHTDASSWQYKKDSLLKKL